MTVIEAEVHTSLRTFLRNQPHLTWPHQLTMARLAARALRLKRPALMQTGNASGYCFSYLTPALLFARPVIVVAPERKQQYLLGSAIPQLKEWLEINTPVQTRKTLSSPSPKNDSGLIVISPQEWLQEQLAATLPEGIPTIIDEADDLEEWAREQLTHRLTSRHWHQLLHDYPEKAEVIRDVRVELTKMLFHRPQNPYECLLLNQPEQEILEKLFILLKEISPHHPFCELFKQSQQDNQLLWAQIQREQGEFMIGCCPVSVREILTPIWERQPLVLIGRFLDWEKEAPIYRQQLGLGEMTCLKFSGDVITEAINLYLPYGLPMPNTKEFQPILLRHLRDLLVQEVFTEGLIVILVSDVPLKRQLATDLAGEFGSRVRLEDTQLQDNGILVCSWQFWREHQQELSTPKLLVMTTIPLPSIENPFVAGQVAYYKQKRQDWFRLYLLPTALRELQRAVVPLRETEGVVALLDNRVHHRSYGKTVLSALEPYERVSYQSLTGDSFGHYFHRSTGIKDHF